MRIFEEEQRFNQWWIYAIFMFVLAVLGIAIFKNSDGFTNFHIPALFLSLPAAAIPIGLILWMQLITRIDHEGIRVKFFPFGFSEKFFQWKQIKECYVRKYNPLTEFGGWGIRGIGKKMAYNVSGYFGIQIVTREGRSFLIGTVRPEEARMVLLKYQHKISNNSNI